MELVKIGDKPRPTLTSVDLRQAGLEAQKLQQKKIHARAEMENQPLSESEESDSAQPRTFEE